MFKIKKALLVVQERDITHKKHPKNNNNKITSNKINEKKKSHFKDTEFLVKF